MSSAFVLPSSEDPLCLVRPAEEENLLAHDVHFVSIHLVGCPFFLVINDESCLVITPRVSSVICQVDDNGILGEDRMLVPRHEI